MSDIPVRFRKGDTVVSTISGREYIVDRDCTFDDPLVWFDDPQWTHPVSMGVKNVRRKT